MIWQAPCAPQRTGSGNVEALFRSREPEENSPLQRIWRQSASSASEQPEADDDYDNDTSDGSLDLEEALANANLEIGSSRNLLGESYVAPQAKSSLISWMTKRGNNKGNERKISFDKSVKRCITNNLQDYTDEEYSATFWNDEEIAKSLDKCRVIIQAMEKHGPELIQRKCRRPACPYGENQHDHK